jgi:hypothetical protein
VKGRCGETRFNELSATGGPPEFHRPNFAADLHPLNPNPRMIAVYVSGVKGWGMPAPDFQSFDRLSAACVARSSAPSL